MLEELCNVTFGVHYFLFTVQSHLKIVKYQLQNLL